jgi:hypothetical protein
MNQDIQDITDKQLIRRMNMYCMLVYSLMILGHKGTVYIPNMINDTNILIQLIYDSQGIREDVHQVLFNEQSNRDCAEGKNSCFINSLGSGGWERTVCANIQMRNASKDENDDSLCYSYSLHEFAYIDNEIFSTRRHSFSNWPGLSLNPGLWNFEYIVNRFNIASQEYHRKVFVDENVDESFEQIFSAVAYALGLNMAYLSIIAFQHIGDVSAYTINGIKRSWTH